MNQPAVDATIMTIENNVRALLADKLQSPSTAIATKKYLTANNQLVYLTVCTVAESAIPSLRIQVYERVEGGVHERSYALFSDRRFEVTENPMIFGEPDPVDEIPKPVDEGEAQALVALVGSLGEL